MSPKIEFFSTSRDYKYFWLKYVVGVNLKVHCAKCLIGEYEKAFSGGIRSVENLTLQKAPVYYLCGVASDRIWAHNLHLAFIYSKGDKIEIDDAFCRIRIINARRIAITPRYIDWNSPESKHKAFNTCRNWQFASMFDKGILEEMPLPSPQPKSLFDI